MQLKHSRSAGWWVRLRCEGRGWWFGGCCGLSIKLLQKRVAISQGPQVPLGGLQIRNWKTHQIQPHGNIFGVAIPPIFPIPQAKPLPFACQLWQLNVDARVGIRHILRTHLKTHGSHHLPFHCHCQMPPLSRLTRCVNYTNCTKSLEKFSKRAGRDP